MAGLLRSLSLRRGHHPALRACPGLLPALHRLLLPGAGGWAELKAAAKRVLTNLGEVPDTDRPLLAYTPHQLAALLGQAGVDASRFLAAGVTGPEFVRLNDGRLGELAAPGEVPRVLRVLKAYEAFAEVDACGECIGQGVGGCRRRKGRARLGARSCSACVIDYNGIAGWCTRKQPQARAAAAWACPSLLLTCPTVASGGQFWLVSAVFAGASSSRGGDCGEAYTHGRALPYLVASLDAFPTCGRSNVVVAADAWWNARN